MVKYCVLLLLAILNLCSVVGNPHCPSRCFCNKHLTSVNCDGKLLKEIPPDIPPQVEKLFLQNNKIAVIPPYSFANFTHLTYLDLRQNIILSVDKHSFSNCPQLQKVYLTANDITDVHPQAFEGSPQVTYLSLQGNRLKSVPSLGPLINLQSLVLQGNKLTNATFPNSFRTNTGLTDIVMSNNMIVYLNNRTFQSLSNATVRKVEITRNHISRVESGTFRPLKQMMSLKIGYNPLGTAELKNFIKGLSHTSLVSLDIRNLSFAGQLPSETFLLLRDTQIRDLKMPNNKINSIPAGAFENLPQLLLLDLSASGIQTVSDTAFKNLTNLQLLFLNDNSLANVPHGLPSSLTKLYLNNNQIEKIENGEFRNLEVLEELYLVENSIRQLSSDSFLGLNQLAKFHISHNQIATLPGKLFNPLTRLQSLELNNNHITYIPKHDGRFSSLTSLVYLNLDDNALSSMPLDVLKPLQSLQYLHLANNQLGPLIASDYSGLLFRGLPKLKELYLSNNAIQQLLDPLLAQQTSLSVLNLSKNRISHWGKNLFVSTRSLQTLNLSLNLISLINETSVSNLLSLESLNLSGNPFACNCNARWFCEWMNKTDIRLPSRSHFTCNLPSGWQGKLMSSFCAAHIDCMDYTPYYIAGGAVAGFLLSLLLLGILYRYRWYVRHRFYKMGRGMRRAMGSRHGYIPLPGDNKLFDIYLSYADEDRDWVMENFIKKFDVGECFGVQNEGKYRVCFRDRDFIPGRSEIGSMDESIPGSRHVVIIASKNYVNCKRCEFELDLAVQLHMEGKIEGYQLVVLGKLPPRTPNRIEMMLQRNNYLEWVDVKTFETAFIERLSDKIGHTYVGNTPEA